MRAMCAGRAHPVLRVSCVFGVASVLCRWCELCLVRVMCVCVSCVVCVLCAWCAWCVRAWPRKSKKSLFPPIACKSTCLGTAGRKLFQPCTGRLSGQPVCLRAPSAHEQRKCVGHRTRSPDLRAPTHTTHTHVAPTQHACQKKDACGAARLLCCSE